MGCLGMWLVHSQDFECVHSVCRCLLWGSMVLYIMYYYVIYNHGKRYGVVYLQ